MAIEIRAAAPEEMDQFADARNYAFATHQAELPNPHPATTLCAFVDGRLCATSAAWPFTVRWNAGAVRAAGVTMVSVRPELQGRGLLRGIMEAALPLYRSQGQAIAMLWASFGAIYQRFGFGPASTTQFYRLDPRLTRLLTDAPGTGSIEVLRADAALSELKSIYIAHAQDRTLALHRAGVMWEYSLLRSRSGEAVFAALYRNADGQPTGYAVYDLQGPDIGTDNRSPDLLAPMQTLTVRDFTSLDPEAYAGLWRFLATHDLVHTICLGPIAPDDPAPLLLAEPNRLMRRQNTGIWLRVVDVEAAVCARGFDVAGEIAFEVVDDRICPWNEGRFWLRSTGGEPATLERATGTPELVLSPRSLSSLLAGHASASQLYRAGLLDAKDAGALLRADAIFATRHAPHCPDGF